MPRTVAVVLDPEFGTRLANLAFRVPVWLADTPANRSAAQEAWHRATDWPHISVTMFRPLDARAPKSEWTRLLDQITLEQRTFDTVDVIGLPLTPPARAALSEAGFEKMEETASGFRARKK